MRKMLAVTFAIWMLLCGSHYFIQTFYVLSGPHEGDLYAYSWGFQALNFTFGYLPFWILALFLVVIAQLFYYTKKAEQGGAPNGYPRHAPCLGASLPAWIAPRVAVADLGRSQKIWISHSKR